MAGEAASAGGVEAWGRWPAGAARCNEATLHFVRPRSREWMFLWRQLLEHTGDPDEQMLNAGESWQYLGTWFHPSAGRWVHELRHLWHPAVRERVSLRLPASAGYQPPAMAAEYAEVWGGEGGRPGPEAELEGWAEYVLSRPGAKQACFHLGRSGRGRRPVWDRLVAHPRRRGSAHGSG